MNLDLKGEYGMIENKRFYLDENGINDREYEFSILGEDELVDIINELNDKCEFLEIENESLEDGAIKYAELYCKLLKENRQLKQQVEYWKQVASQYSNELNVFEHCKKYKPKCKDIHWSSGGMTEKRFRVQEHCLRSSYGIEAENWLVTNDNNGVVLNDKAEAHMVANMCNDVIDVLNEQHKTITRLEKENEQVKQQICYLIRELKTERETSISRNKRIRLDFAITVLESLKW